MSPLIFVFLFRSTEPVTYIPKTLSLDRRAASPLPHESTLLPKSWTLDRRAASPNRFRSPSPRLGRGMRRGGSFDRGGSTSPGRESGFRRVSPIEAQRPSDPDTLRSTLGVGSASVSRSRSFGSVDTRFSSPTRRFRLHKSPSRDSSGSGRSVSPTTSLPQCDDTDSRTQQDDVSSDEQQEEGPVTVKRVGTGRGLRHKNKKPNSLPIIQPVQLGLPEISVQPATAKEFSPVKQFSYEDTDQSDNSVSSQSGLASKSASPSSLEVDNGAQSNYTESEL